MELGAKEVPREAFRKMVIEQRDREGVTVECSKMNAKVVIAGAGEGEGDGDEDNEEMVVVTKGEVNAAMIEEMK